MEKYIILFKSVNVAGKNLLPMKSLVSLLEQHSYQDVSYYIQSGNITLRAEQEPTSQLQSIITDNFGFTPEIFVFIESQWLEILQANPYKTYEGKFVHFYFCHNAIALDAENLTKYKALTETYLVRENIFYLHAPDGIGRSKLVANIEACLGQITTGRNLNTTNKIALMINNT